MCFAVISGVCFAGDLCRRTFVCAVDVQRNTRVRDSVGNSYCWNIEAVASLLSQGPIISQRSETRFPDFNGIWVTQQGLLQ